MTRKRDIQRRFLEKNGWWYNFHFTPGWNDFLQAHPIKYDLDRESAFKIELKNHPRSVRRELKRRIAECQE